MGSIDNSTDNIKNEQTDIQVKVHEESFSVQPIRRFAP